MSLCDPLCLTADFVAAAAAVAKTSTEATMSLSLSLCLKSLPPEATVGTVPASEKQCISDYIARCISDCTAYSREKEK